MPGPEPIEGVIARAVRLLEAFDSRSTSLTVSDLSRRAGLPLSTTSRMVAELVRHGLLSRSDDGRRIRIGVRLWELGSRAAPTRTLREAALPFMEDLHTVIHHHVQLGVLDGQEVLFVERLSAHEAVINVTEVAGRLPLHASSSGLVLLAYAPPEIQRAGFVHTPGHIRDAAAGVAVPVRDTRERVVASLGVVVPNDDVAVRA